MNNAEIKKLMEKVNDYWIKRNPESGDCAWERGAYFIGDLEAYRVTAKTEYLNYAVKWADDNDWKFYNDPEYNTENADNIICGQTYLDMLDLGIDSATDQHMLKTMDNLCADSNNTYWWWIDTIYMALPLFYRMAKRYNNKKYAQKGYALYTDTKVRRKLFDEEEGLWYRDENFMPGGSGVPGNEKVFWGRGNGWIFAGIARALMYIDREDEHFDEYAEMLNVMAEELIKYQQKDGFWRCNIKVPGAIDVPETSATVLIGYGMALGVRLGVLDKSYMESAIMAFEGINRIAINDDGKIGYVQGVACTPTPVYKDVTNDYAVGTYLLFASEIIKANN